MIRILAISLLLACSWHVHGASQPELQLSLKVKPTLCLRYSEQEYCEVDVWVNWRSQESVNICLHSSSEKLKPIQCWETSTGDDVFQELALDMALVYWLSYPQSETRLISKTVDIATLLKNPKRSNRQRRHIWSLI